MQGAQGPSSWGRTGDTQKPFIYRGVDEGEESAGEGDPKAIWQRSVPSSPKSVDSSKELSERSISHKKQKALFKLGGVFKKKEKDSEESTRLILRTNSCSKPEDKLIVESRCLKPVYEAAHLSSRPKQWLTAGSLNEVLPSEYKCDYKGCYPLTIDTGFSFGQLNGFHPIYLKKVRTVYLLAEAGKQWEKTREYGIKDAKFETGYPFNKHSYTETVKGEQEITEIMTTITTSVKRWGLQSFSKIVKKKKYTGAVAEKKIAFVELEKGKVVRIHVNDDYYKIMKGLGSNSFTFDIKDVIKHSYLLMPPNGYEIRSYDNEGYQDLIAKFNSSL